MKITRSLLITIFLIFCISLIALNPQNAQASRIYVDAAANGANNGRFWNDAYTDLQSALSAAVPGDVICVMAGTYKPSIEHGGTGDRYKSFQLKNGVAIYGGFAGGETRYAQRDLSRNVTILSGDVGIPGDTSDNSYHVFYHPGGMNLNSTAVLDGFTITGGNANGSAPHHYGGGMFNHGSSPTLTNCTFTDNFHEGMHNYDSFPVLTNCTFIENFHGGMHNRDSSPTLANCTFANNFFGMYNSSSSPTLTNCTFADNSGKGMYNLRSSPTLTNCIFYGNSSARGGGLHNLLSSPILTNCTFFGNSADFDGGGIYNDDSSPFITNCTFFGNSAGFDGGGIYNDSSSPVITNSIFWGDTAVEGNEIYNDGGSSPLVMLSTIQGGYPGIGNLDIDPLFVDPGHGDFHLQAGSSCIDTGFNSASNLPAIDIDGDNRIIDGNRSGTAIVDRGADEFPSIYYVDAAASGGNNGTSWANAYTNLQRALSAAGAGSEIWVATSTYKPSIAHGGTGARYRSFQLKNGVGIYGGFAGDETNRNQRDLSANVTILSGDIGIQGDNADNCYHVFYHPDGTNLDHTAILDGFTITGGNANGPSHYEGGGMYNDNSSSPTLSNCIFVRNTAEAGGGISNDRYSSPRLTNCIFFDNSATWGGGMQNKLRSDPDLTNCTFFGNSGTWGGGINNSRSFPVLTNCILWGNTASIGDQIYDGSPTVAFSNIQGGHFGVGNIASNPLFVDPAHGDFRLQPNSSCIDAGNNSAQRLPATDIDGKARIIDGNSDGTVHVDMGAIEYRRPIIYVNAEATGINEGMSWVNAYTDLQNALSAALPGDEIWVAAGTYIPSVEHGGTGDRYKSFQLKNKVGIYGGFTGTETSRDQRDWLNNITILSGDIGIQGDDADNSYHVFYHPEGTNLDGTAILDGFSISHGRANGPSSHKHGGGMFNDGSSPTLTNCTFSGNTASITGGGMRNVSSSLTLNNCVFHNNSAKFGGGMINVDLSPTLTNCTFDSNSAGFDGGGVYNYSSSPTLTNCTFSGNSASQFGGGMYNTDSSPTLTNCILWDDSAVTGSEIYNVAGSLPIVTYSDIQGGYSGIGNIDANPWFVDPAHGDFHLVAYSPCIDTGDNSAPYLPAADFEGNVRIMDGNSDGIAMVDMGVAEHAEPIIMYVDAGAGGANNGISWFNAYTDLQSALSVASPGDEIWVAAGTYRPSVEHGGTGERYKSFQLKNGVGIYGGFSGDETGRNQRDWENNVTILSGDIGIPGDMSDNSYHVFFHPEGTNLDSTAILDGFTITAGNANGPHHTMGGGVYNTESSPVLSHCTFFGNSASYGGGMANLTSSPILMNCTFFENSAHLGGGMYNDESSPTLDNCAFNANDSSNFGGGVYNTESSPVLSHCTFFDNSAPSGGGMANWASSPILNNCTFSNNSASNKGGGMFNTESSPTLDNCTFSGNSATNSDSFYHYGGGMYNISFSSPTLRNCTFSDNSTSHYGGGIANFVSSSPTLINCTFFDNSALLGGGVFNGHSLSTLTNCTFYDNSATDSGGGMANWTSSPILINCTFSGNSANSGGGVSNSWDSSLRLTNCIFWGNSAEMENEIQNQHNSSTSLTYSDIQGGYEGTGNINADPLFVDPANGNFRLRPGSPCIDAGSNVAPNLPDTDFEGNDRILDGDGDGIAIVDMGVHESTSSTWPGGFVNVSGGFTRIFFPPGTISGAINVSVFQVDTVLLPPFTGELLGNVYDFSVYSLTGSPITGFNEAVSLTLQYDPELVALKGLIEEDLKILYYDALLTAWMPVPSVVDTVNHTVTGQTDHSALFGIFGSNPVPEPTTLVLVGLGLFGLLALARRSRNMRK